MNTTPAWDTDQDTQDRIADLKACDPKYHSVLNENTEFTTVEDLIEILQTYPPEASVYLAFQPSWPLAYNVSDVVLTIDRQENEQRPVNTAYGVWFAEGGARLDSPYVPGHVREALAW